jgi:thiol-disulfide isomerase/thioredoxin
MRRAPALVGWAAVLALGCFGAGPGDGRPAPGSLDKALPADGRPALVVFFSTGCPTCFDDLLEMARFVRRNKLELPIVGVCGDSESDIEEFVEKYSVHGAIVRDERGRIRRKFKVDLLPYKIVLAGEKVLYRDDYYLPLGERSRRAQRCLIELTAGSRSGSRS